MIRLLTTIGLLSVSLSGCFMESPSSAREEAVGTSTEAMSRCGYPPRRPRGCTARCECSEPVNGPFGEDIGDYDCSTGTCVLEPRADCSFEVTCPGD